MLSMKQKYINEVENHLEILLPTIQGMEYKYVAELIYSTVQAAEQAVNVREHQQSVLRRQIQATKRLNANDDGGL